MGSLMKKIKLGSLLEHCGDVREAISIWVASYNLSEEQTQLKFKLQSALPCDG